jgi:hypothetical protein
MFSIDVTRPVAALAAVAGLLTVTSSAGAQIEGPSVPPVLLNLDSRCLTAAASIPGSNVLHGTELGDFIQGTGGVDVSVPGGSPSHAARRRRLLGRRCAGEHR